MSTFWERLEARKAIPAGNGPKRVSGRKPEAKERIARLVRELDRGSADEALREAMRRERDLGRR